MRLLIFDVSHGFCAYLQADNNNVMLFDCGHNENTGFRPSTFLSATGCNGIERFYILNYDQDHISDLPNIRQLSYKVPIYELYRNKTISAPEIETLKLQNGPLTNAADSVIEMLGTYTLPVTEPKQFPDIDAITYYNSYPNFTDTNNLSMVVFLKYGHNCICLPGDMEKTGWDELLKQGSFRNDLACVNIFVAPHHGRETGYNADVFNYASPDIVIVSDKEVIHETQKQKWGQHAKGILWNGGPDKRFVLTTRSEGNLFIEMTRDSGYHITTGYQL